VSQELGFRPWLNKQREREDPVGDIARDMREDSCAKGLRSRSGLRKHIEEKHGASDAAVAALERAWEEWRG